MTRAVGLSTNLCGSNKGQSIPIRSDYALR